MFAWGSKNTPCLAARNRHVSRQILKHPETKLHRNFWADLYGFWCREVAVYDDPATCTISCGNLMRKGAASGRWPGVLVTSCAVALGQFIIHNIFSEPPWATKDTRPSLNQNFFVDIFPRSLQRLQLAGLDDLFILEVGKPFKFTLVGGCTQ